jgi:hypothetical protein
MKAACATIALLFLGYAANADTNAPSAIAYSVNVSHTFDSELERHHIDYGDFSATLLRASAVRSWSPNEQWSWRAGPVFEYARFDADRQAPLPERGYVTALLLGGDWQINDRWGLHADIRPGLYSDFEDISFADFNAPFIAAVSYRVSSNFLAVLALGVNLRSDLGTIGGPGIRWRFAELWTLNLILPKPVVEFAVAPSVTLYGGGEWRSFSFRTAEDFTSPGGSRRLRDDDFSYRELRGLAGARWQPSRKFNVALEGGYAFDRRAEYRDASVELDGGSAPFLQISMGGAF